MTTRSSPALSGGSHLETSSGGHATQGAAGKGNCPELVSPNTPFDCGHEFSDTTLSGQSPSAVSPAASQEVTSKPILLPSKSPAPHIPWEPLGTSRSLPGQLQSPTGRSRAADKLHLKQPGREFGMTVDLSRSPHKPRTDEILARRPAFTGLSEHSSNKAVAPDWQQLGKDVTVGSKKNRKGRLRETEFQENVPPPQVSSADRSAGRKHRQPGDIGWRYNQTFVKERQASWQRPSIKIPGEAEDAAVLPSAIVTALGKSPENTDRSLPWPAISPKEAAYNEQEAWYMEQVSEALAWDPMHVAAFMETLERYKAKAITPAAAHEQVAVILAGHPALVEGFGSLLPREQRIWPEVQPVAASAVPGPEERREEEQAIETGRAKLLPDRTDATPQTSEQSAGRASDATRQARRGSPRRRGGPTWPLRAWRALAPPPQSHYLPWCTVLFSATCLFVFFYMAGGYGIFKVEQLAAHGRLTIAERPGADLVAGRSGAVSREMFAQYVDYSPRALRDWLSAEPGWRSFDEPYLVAWGARQLPLVAGGHWWLWATSAFLHVNFMQLAGNLVPWMAVSFLLEIRFGALRIAPLFLAALLGAAFASAALDPPCGLVAGSNGLLAGMVPLLCASLIADWKTLAFPFLQLLLSIAAVALHITIAIMQAAEPWQSHWAELGGFVCGLLPSIIFTPGPADKRWRPATRLAARCGLAVTGGRTRGRKRRRAPTASPSDATGLAAEERPLRSLTSAPRLPLTDDVTVDEVAHGSDVPMESPMPTRPTKRRLTAPRPDAVAHVYIGAPEEERALRERWAPNSPGLRGGAEWREQRDGSFHRAKQLSALRKEAARPGQYSDAIAAHRPVSLHDAGAVEMAHLTPDEEVRDMEEGGLRRRAPNQALPRRAPNQAQHRQQASTESVASSLTSAGTADGSAGAAAEEIAVAAEGSPRQRTGKAWRMCSPWGLARLAFCLVSTILFLGTLVGLPVYLYLVKFPSLDCPI
ncbi:probable RHOMBOID-like protein 5 at C-terminar half [Coccomyxa sp. Obi]|nr:probable RHOMBOID-like protein 5 at C-terminar half [Coccomyxa sp. Obi]